MLTLGGIMKIQMDKLDMKQEALAKELNIARTTVTSYCNDKRQPDFQMLAKICKALQINLSKVLDLYQFDNQDMILHDDYEYKINHMARTVSKENRQKFMEGISFMAEILKEK